MAFSLPRSSHDARGAVYVEKLIVFLPLLTAFFATWELAELGSASLIVQRASAAAGRAATVVLADDPAFYDGEEIGSFSGQRREDVELSAGMILSSHPRLGADFVVDVSEPSQVGDPLEVDVVVPYDCGPVSLVCGKDGAFDLSASTVHTYHGARYDYTLPADVGSVSQSLTSTSEGPRLRAKNNGAGSDGESDSCTLACKKCKGSDDKARYNQLKNDLDRVTADLYAERKKDLGTQDIQKIDRLERELDKVLGEFNQCQSCGGWPKHSDKCLSKPRPDKKKLISDIQNNPKRFCAKGNSVFWSGGKVAVDAAQAWAKSHGAQTLEQTVGGYQLDNMDLFSRESCSGMTRKDAASVWNAASIAFAECAQGKVIKFQDCNLPKNGDSLGTWDRLEYPTLKQNDGVTEIVGSSFSGQEEELCD